MHTYKLNDHRQSHYGVIAKGPQPRAQIQATHHIPVCMYVFMYACMYACVSGCHMYVCICVCI